MLEIILMVVLAGKLSAIAKTKGRSGGWAALGPVFWIVGEVTGAAVAMMAGMDGLGLYGGALAGAAVGALLAFVVVNGISPNEDLVGPGFGVEHSPIPGGHYDPMNPYNPPGGSSAEAGAPTDRPDAPGG